MSEASDGIDLTKMPNYSGPHVVQGGEFDGLMIQQVDGRDVALMVVVERNGVATASATIPKAEAIKCLLTIVAEWQAELAARD